MNKTLIIFGLVIIIIGILVVVLNKLKQKEFFEDKPSLTKIAKSYWDLAAIAKAFWANDEKAGKIQTKIERKTKKAAIEAKVQIEKKTKKAAIKAAIKAQVETEKTVSKVESVQAAVESETARKLSKKTCLNGIVNYATSLVKQSKIAQERSERALKFIAEIKNIL